MAMYKVRYEIELEANSPLEATETVQKWISENEGGCIFTMQDQDTRKCFSVDLNEIEDDEVLNISEREFNTV